VANHLHVTSFGNLPCIDGVETWPIDARGSVRQFEDRRGY